MEEVQTSSLFRLQSIARLVGEDRVSFCRCRKEHGINLLFVPASPVATRNSASPAFSECNAPLVRFGGHGERKVGER